MSGETMRTKREALELARGHVEVARWRAQDGYELDDQFNFTLHEAEGIYAGRDPQHGVGVTVGYGRGDGNWVTVYEDGHVQYT